jgi:inner membrane protein
MPTIFSHAAVGFIATKVTRSNKRVIAASMILAALPDADGLFFGRIPYGDPFGHRGFTHSLFFACFAGLLTAGLFSRASWAAEWKFWKLASLFALVTASHGFFDAMTDGGLGVAFFAPFSNRRYFFPWRPIPVAPMSPGVLLSERGFYVLRAEAELFWTFALAVVIWDHKKKMHILLASAFAIVGIAFWVLALTRA